MKIVDRSTFLSMPEGTLFHKYKPYIFEDLSIKYQTLGDDFVSLCLSDPIVQNQVSIAWDENSPIDYSALGRDGLFDQSQLFAVYDKDDTEGLVKILQDALVLCATKD